MRFAINGGLFGVLAATAIMFATAVGGASPNAKATDTANSTPRKVKIALNWKPEPQFGGFYAASIEKIDRKNGLDIDILPGGSGTPTVQMLAAGQADFAVVSADEVIVSRANGTDIVAIFATYQTNPQGIMVHRDRGFKSIADVFAAEGQLAMQSGLPYAQFLSRAFGGSKQRVRIVPYAGGIGPFLADKKFSQQVFVTSEPLAAKRAGADAQTFLVAEAGFNPYTTVVATRRALIDKDRDLVSRMAKTVREGWTAYVGSGPNPVEERVNAEMHKLNPAMDLATMKESAEAQRSLIKTATTDAKGLGHMTIERWTELHKQIKEQLPRNRAGRIPEPQGLFLNL